MILGILSSFILIRLRLFYFLLNLWGLDYSVSNSWYNCLQRRYHKLFMDRQRWFRLFQYFKQRAEKAPGIACLPSCSFPNTYRFIRALFLKVVCWLGKGFRSYQTSIARERVKRELKSMCSFPWGCSIQCCHQQDPSICVCSAAAGPEYCIKCAELLPDCLVINW